MNALRCVGLLVIVLLSACDAQDASAPPPKLAVEAQTTPTEPAPAIVVESRAEPVVAATIKEPGVAPVVIEPEPPKTVVHQLTPNVPVVPVVVTKADASAAPKSASALSKTDVVKAPASTVPIPKTKAESTIALKRESAAGKKALAAKGEVTKDTRLSNHKLDLSLPPEMAKELTPLGAAKPAVRKPLLPQMFGDKEGSGRSPFELNGRLLSNEMQLQMRNDNRHDVEGAALDFKFKQ